MIFHRDLEALKQAQQIAAEWLKGMGLEMKPSKTRITHTLHEVDGSVGFDFLGFHFRQYPRGKNRCVHDAHWNPVGFTTNVRPSTESQKRFLRRIREVGHSKRTIHQAGLIALPNPIIRGWGNYFSPVVSKAIFRKMDMHIFQKLWAWARRRHPHKGRRWIARKYWLLDQRGWMFGAKGIITLHKLSKIPIRRHIVVKKHRSPYDGDALYWSTRAGNRADTNRRVDPMIRPGKTYTINSLYTAVRRACERASIERFTPYDLRRTAATRVRAALGKEEAKLLLGHVSADTTEIYLLDEVKETMRAAKRMENPNPEHARGVFQ